MTCEQIRIGMAEYLAGRMSAGDRAAFLGHVDHCEACAAEVEEFTALWRDLDDLPLPMPSTRMLPRFRAMLHAYERSSRPSNLAMMPSRPWMWGALAASLFVGGLLAGHYLGRNSAANTEIASLKTEVEGMRQMVTLTLLQQQSAGERLRGVTWSNRMERPDSAVENALLTAVNRDPNVNVRLSAVDALQKFTANPAVRRALVDAIPVQDSPLVQIALIDAIVPLGDASAGSMLRQLAADPHANEAVRKRANWGLRKLGVA